MSVFINFIQNNTILILSAFSALLFLLILWNFIMHLKIRRINKKNEILFSGNKVKNLEEVLLDQAKTLKLLDKDIQELFNISNQINDLAFQSLHKVGIVRFNPFKDVGGNQSFSIALLDGKNNGITLSSFFTREGTRVYSKSIIKGETEKHPLTEEEKQAIKIAMEDKNKK